MSLTNKQIQDWYAAGYLTQQVPKTLGPGSGKIVDRLTPAEQQHLTIMSELVEIGMRPKPASGYAWSLWKTSVEKASRIRPYAEVASPTISLGEVYLLSRVHSGHPLRGLRSTALRGGDNAADGS